MSDLKIGEARRKAPFVPNDGVMQAEKETKEKIREDGFAIINHVFSGEEADGLLSTIAAADGDSPAFRKTADVFAIRRLLQDVPALAKLLFTQRFRQLIQ